MGQDKVVAKHTGHEAKKGRARLKGSTTACRINKKNENTSIKSKCITKN